MAIGRAERFEERKPRVVAVFGDDDETILAVSHVFELMEMAWHDCYAEASPSEEVVDDVLFCSQGTLGGLIHAAHMAVDLTPTSWSVPPRRALRPGSPGVA